VKNLLDLRQRIQFALLTLSRIALGFFDLALAAAMYLLFMLLQRRAPSLHLWWMPATALAAAFLATTLIALRAFVDLASSRSVFRSIQNLYVDFLLRLTRGYSEMEWSRFVEHNRSELGSQALHTSREAADFYHRSIEFIAGAATLAVMTAAIAWQSLPAAAAFAIALAAFYCLHRFLIRGKISQAASDREESVRSLERLLADFLMSGKEIRTYRNYAFFQDRIQLQASRLAQSSRRTVFLPQIGRIIADQGTMLLFLGLIVAVELQHGDTGRLLSLLAFYFVLSRRLLPLVSQMSLIAGQLESSRQNVRIVAERLNECQLYRAPLLLTSPPPPGWALEIHRLSFSFRSGGPILRDVNLSLRAGETVILCGASGIGKSSLLNLIAGVLQPASGVVRVDGSNIAYVPQEIALLDDSIRNNLLFGLRETNDDELMRALAVARLDDFVRAQPRGLETAVGDNGALFSGGQRQRLGLARSILRRPRLLLLDEATSALDEKTEREVLQNLNASGAAVLLATHRTSMRAFAHRLYRVEQGRLIEELKGDAAAELVQRSTSSMR
jgi:ABC-type multidrug transport system fused ATPase/permease subunit